MYSIPEESINKVSKNSNKVSRNKKTIVCELCDYYTTRKSNTYRHFSTLKHKKNAINYNKFCNKSVTNDDNCIKKNFICEICDRGYKYRSGLWRHKKVCMGEKEILDETVHNMKIDNRKIDNRKIDNRKIDNRKIDNRKIYNRKIYNNNISINLFLNEHCKNAICIEDFISGIKLTLEDLLSHKDLGYADSMSNVLMKNLEKIPGTKRPIHSTDVKRLKFMVKKADGWEKDDGTTVNDVVREVKFKQVDKINEWEKDNPNFQNNSEKMIEWNDMMSVFDSGTNKKMKEKNNKSIKKK
jgi:hypothetical protein